MGSLRFVRSIVRMVFSAKFLKFAAVSGVAIVVSVTTFQIAFNVAHWRAVPAQALAVAVSTPVSFYLNRAWVWQKSGKSHFRKEVVPFWITSIAGFVFSLLAAWIGEKVAKHYFDRRGQQAIVIQLFNLGSYGVGWLGKFAYFEKVLFKHDHASASAA